MTIIFHRNKLVCKFYVTVRCFHSEKELVELFNQNYRNIVENSSGKKPLSLGDCLNTSQDELTVKEFISVGR